MTNDSDERGPPTPGDAGDSPPSSDKLEQKPLPMTERELRVVVREIVTEVLEDADRRRGYRPTSMLGGLLQDLQVSDFGITPRHLAIAAISAVALIVVPMFIILRPRTIDLRPEILGTWTTTDQRYADRGFRLTDSTLTLYTGTQDSILHQIERVVGEEDFPGKFSYTIFHSLYGTEYEFSFHYEQADTTIQFKNQPEMTWRKDVL
ncbi:MAG: hypothetical protein O7I93_10305 [Gemmatimonadetes bacterium]|nr:hypothetical protein [Gemmatimonadota bacterium]